MKTIIKTLNPKGIFSWHFPFSWPENVLLRYNIMPVNSYLCSVSEVDVSPSSPNLHRALEKLPKKYNSFCF